MKKQTLKIKKLRHGIALVIVLVLKFLKLYPMDVPFLGRNWVSLSQLQKACSAVNGFADGCGLVGFFNVIWWILVIGLLGYFLYFNKDNIKTLLKKLQ